MKKLIKISCVPIILAMLLLPACTVDFPATSSSAIASTITTIPVTSITSNSSTITSATTSGSTIITPITTPVTTMLPPVSTTTPGPTVPVPDYFTIVAIPDTQIYARDSLANFKKITNWIVDNKTSQNIVFAVHEGDIVDDAHSISQWVNAKIAMDILRAGGVPYSVLPGNHDSGNYPYGGFDFTNYNMFFPSSDFSVNNWFGGSYPSNSMENNYNLIKAGGQNYIIINIEYSPLAVGDALEVYAWANRILDAYSNYRALIVTHAFLNSDGTDSNPTAVDLFNGMIAQHSNIFAVLCGHYWEAQHIIKTGIDGNRIDVMMFNMQDMQNGGDGDIRLYRFFPASDKIEVHTYSTFNSIELTDANNRFDIPYKQNGLIDSTGKDYLPYMENSLFLYNNSNSERSNKKPVLRK